MTDKCGCPDVYPAWDDEDIDLCGYHVHHLSVPMLIHMPLAYESYLDRQQKAIERLELEELWPRLTLTRTGMFRGSLMRLLKPTGPSLSSHIKVLPCPFKLRARLHHGNLSTAQRQIREMQMKMVDDGCMPKELYLSHLTCPACSDQRSEKILLLRRWKESAMLKRRMRS